ncbi:unnamed protein product [Arctia plantaginis]|nr:unnamed protein product [Arctia plantaginis]
MSKIMLLLFVFCTVFVAIYGKHLHPRSIVHFEEGIDDGTKAIDTNIDGMEIEMIRRIKPSWFVPVNNVLFFKSYPPCEDGFERDLRGVCREVW